MRVLRETDLDKSRLEKKMLLDAMTMVVSACDVVDIEAFASMRPHPINQALPIHRRVFVSMDRINLRSANLSTLKKPRDTRSTQLRRGC